MDHCRISWGKIDQIITPSVDGGNQYVLTRKPLVYTDKLYLGRPEKYQVVSQDQAYKKGDTVAVHWGWICAKLSAGQLENLAFYTRKAIDFANIYHPAGL